MNTGKIIAQFYEKPPRVTILKKLLAIIWQNRRQWLLGVFIIFMLLLFLDLNRRIGELYTLTNQRDQMRTQVQNLQATERALHKQIAYATSESAVEEWAREDNNLSQSGDKVIIPLPQPGYTVVPTIQPTPTMVVLENWQVWSLLFFGDRSRP
jgi:cell division protein FtsB